MRDEPSKLVAASSWASFVSADQTIDPSIEYWSKLKPYTSSSRTFGKVELISAIYHESSPTLFVRGWIFDQQTSLSTLTLFSSSNQPGTTVSQLVREDVAQAFTALPQARLSGFVSLLPTQDIPGQLCIRGSYRCADTLINFAFEEQPVSLGIAVPGVTIPPPPHNIPDASGGIALIVTPGWELPQDLLVALKKHAQEIQARLWIFYNRELAGTSCDLKVTETEVVAPSQAVASILWGRTQMFRRIIIAGPIDEAFINRQLLPLITTSPQAPLIWLAPSATIQFTPRLLQGGVVRFFELPTHSYTELLKTLLAEGR